MSDTNELRAVKLTELLERCEKATGPDRELDADIAEANGWYCHYKGGVDHWIGPGPEITPPRYTDQMEATVMMLRALLSTSDARAPSVEEGKHG